MPSAPFSAESRRLRSRVGNLAKVDPAHPQLPTARRDLRAARLADYVAEVVAQAPPLTDAQRDRIASLLRPGVSA